MKRTPMTRTQLSALAPTMFEAMAQIDGTVSAATYTPDLEPDTTRKVHSWLSAFLGNGFCGMDANDRRVSGDTIVGLMAAAVAHASHRIVDDAVTALVREAQRTMDEHHSAAGDESDHPAVSWVDGVQTPEVADDERERLAEQLSDAAWGPTAANHTRDHLEAAALLYAAAVLRRIGVRW